MTCRPRDRRLVRVEPLVEQPAQNDVVISAGGDMQTTLAEPVPDADVETRLQQDVDDVVVAPIDGDV